MVGNGGTTADKPQCLRAQPLASIHCTRSLLMRAHLMGSRLLYLQRYNEHNWADTARSWTNLAKARSISGKTWRPNSRRVRPRHRCKTQTLLECHRCQTWKRAQSVWRICPIRRRPLPSTARFYRYSYCEAFPQASTSVAFAWIATGGASNKFNKSGLSPKAWGLWPGLSFFDSPESAGG